MARATSRVAQVVSLAAIAAATAVAALAFAAAAAAVASLAFAGLAASGQTSQSDLAPAPQGQSVTVPDQHPVPVHVMGVDTSCVPVPSPPAVCPGGTR